MLLISFITFAACLPKRSTDEDKFNEILEGSPNIGIKSEDSSSVDQNHEDLDSDSENSQKKWVNGILEEEYGSKNKLKKNDIKIRNRESISNDDDEDNTPTIRQSISNDKIRSKRSALIFDDDEENRPSKKKLKKKIIKESDSSDNINLSEIKNEKIINKENDSDRKNKLMNELIKKINEEIGDIKKYLEEKNKIFEEETKKINEKNAYIEKTEKKMQSLMKKLQELLNK